MEPLTRGTTVVKVNSLPGQPDGDGSIGRVTQAIGPALGTSGAPGAYGYMVAFETHPEVPVFVPDSRLRFDGVDVSERRVVNQA